MLAGTANAYAQTLSLQIQDGRATLDARGVSVKAILDEWATLTGAIIVGSDRVSREPVTLYLVDVLERTALAVVLRQTGGYILAEGARGNASTIGRILIMPATAAAAGPPPPAPPVAPRQPKLDQLPFEPATMPQVGLEGPEQELVDISEGLRDQPTVDQAPTQRGDSLTAPPSASGAPISPFSVTGGSPRPGTVSPAPPPVTQ